MTPRGYKDPRYYAGMRLLCGDALDREISHYENSLARFPNDERIIEDARSRLATMREGDRLSREAHFTASFQDETYGFYWWLKAEKPAGHRVAASP